MKRYLNTFFTLAWLLAGGTLHAQTDRPILKERQRPEDIWKRAFVAINLTPSFGSGAFGADISPTFGYRVTEHFNAAAGPLYMFTSFGSRVTGGGRVTASIWGGRVWAQHRIFRTFFAHGEYEVMNAIPLVVTGGSRIYDTNPDGSFPRRALGTPLLGVAFVQEGEQATQSLTILYNLNYMETLTPYEPLLNLPIIFRASLSFNLGGR